jgi:hypothetical protein
MAGPHQDTHKLRAAFHDLLQESERSVSVALVKGIDKVIALYANEQAIDNSGGNV